MYPTVLFLHSWVRWLVIVLGVWALAEAARGRAAGRAGLFFTIGLDVQLLLGVFLYVALSPVTQAALADVAGAMRSPTSRFWAVEHPALMVLAVVFGHVGRIVARRSPADPASPRPSTWLWYALALLAILAAMPWPFLAHGRPLFRALGSGLYSGAHLS
jgi:hypothetical protein